MEFARDHWCRDPASAWLVKRLDDRVHAGVIQRADVEMVELLASGRITLIRAAEIDWIRPLLAAEVDGWNVFAGFQAEDHTFDTWWSRGRVLYCINYSGPTGFSDLARLIEPLARPQTVDPPSAEARGQARAQIARALEERSGVRVAPIDHLQ